LDYFISGTSGYCGCITNIHVFGVGQGGKRAMMARGKLARGKGASVTPQIFSTKE